MKKSNLIPKQKYIRRRTVDEKKVREVIDELKSLIYVRKRTLAALPTSARKDSLYNNEITALETAIGALEKQLPKKPNFEGDGYDPDGTFVYDTWECPNCGECYEVDYDDYDYCPKCGQKIDWSE
mgnify:CR=1 FL=1